MSFTCGEARGSDVYLAAAARGVSSCGDFLAATALALVLQTAGAGGMAVSGLLIAAALPLVVLAPATGRLADRVDSRILLVGAGLAQSVVCVAMAYTGSPVLIVALAGLLACGLAVTQPVLSALVPEMVGRDDLPRASAINQTAGTLGILAGPALAGLLVGEFGQRLPLLIDAGSYLALVAAGLLLRTRRGGAHRSSTCVAAPAAPAFPAETATSAEPTNSALPTNSARPVAGRGTGLTGRPSWRLRRDPVLLAMVGSLAAVIGAVGAINVFEVFYIRETLGGSTTTYGVVTGTWTVGVLVGTALSARLSRRLADDGAQVLAALAMLGGCCLMVLVAAVVPTAAFLVPLWLIGGACNGGDNVFTNVVTVRRVPPEFRGRAFAALGAAIQGASMLGYLLGGLLLAAFSPRPLVAAAGVAGLLAVAGFVVPVRRAAGRERAVTGTTGPAGEPIGEYVTSPVAG